MITEVDPAADVPALLGALHDALDGGPALAPVPRDPSGPAVRRAARLDQPVGRDIALLLPTSGSTGSPKVVALGADALRHSAAATHDRLGGPGRWLLALPLTHVAGWQVLVRSLDARLDPLSLNDFDDFARAAAATDAPRRYTSLVPTQLARLLAHAPSAEALATFDGVLIGGAAAPAPLLDRARAAGVRVVTTYGMTETSGGCVYDGRPLRDVRVRVDDLGRVLLSGPVLARGYRGRDQGGFVRQAGERWFATSDAGQLAADGALEVRGRLDDVIVTGGEKVAPAAVEEALVGRAGVVDCVVVGVPDEHWGHTVVAVVVPDAGRRPTTDDVRSALRDRLPASALPRHIVLVDELAQRGPGKPDRAAATALARLALTPDG